MPKRYRDIAGDGGSNIVGQVEAQQARLRERLSRVRSIVAIVSGKGGVGKSSVTANLAACFALNGRQVGVLDADLNGPTMAKMLGVRGGKLVVRAGGVEPPRNALGVKVMSMDLLLPSDAAPLTWDAPTQDEAHTWRGTMEANALREFLADTDWGVLDLLLIDLPPGTDRLVTVTSLVPVLTGSVVVTITSDVSQLVVRKSLTVAAQGRAPVLGLVENMAGLFAGPDVEALARESGTPFLGRVPFDAELAQAADRGEPFVALAPARHARLHLVVRHLVGRHEVVVPRRRESDRPERGLAVEAEHTRAARERPDVHPAREVLERGRLVDEHRDGLVHGAAVDRRDLLHPFENGGEAVQRRIVRDGGVARHALEQRPDVAGEHRRRALLELHLDRKSVV